MHVYCVVCVCVRAHVRDFCRCYAAYFIIKCMELSSFIATHGVLRAFAFFPNANQNETNLESAINDKILQQC